MQAAKILKGITKFEEFDFNTLKLYRKDGFCTLAKKEDLSFLYEELWFKNWEKFDINHYLVEREDGLQTIINRKDASFVYDNLWFDWWHTTKFGYYEVSLKEKINYVKKDDGTFLFSEFIPQNRIIESDNYDNKIYVLENEKICMYEL